MQPFIDRSYVVEAKIKRIKFCKKMHSASAVRIQIEATLARRIPSALTPATKAIRPVASTGIDMLDDLLHGGLPIGAVSEFIGPECSGRTSVALSMLARLTQSAKICAWIDAGDAFDPLSAAAAGLDLERLLWVRCGVTTGNASHRGNSFAVPPNYLIPPVARKGLHGGGFGPHPRTEVNGLSTAIEGLFQPEIPESPRLNPRCAEPQLRRRPSQHTAEPLSIAPCARPFVKASGRPWSRIEQALRTADLLLQGGGFSAIVLDLGSLSPEFVSRVPLATWYRYRAAAERTQSSIVLLTQYACAKSSAELVLEFQLPQPIGDERTIFTGIQPHVQLARQRFVQTPANVVPLRKPPQSARVVSWASRTVSAGPR